MNCSPSGSSVLGIFQARIPKWVAFPSPGDLPDLKTKATSLISPALAGGFFTTNMMWEALRELTENQCSLPKREVSSLHTTETVPSSSLELGQVSATLNPSIVQNCFLCILWATHIPWAENHSISNLWSLPTTLATLSWKATPRFQVPDHLYTQILSFSWQPLWYSKFPFCGLSGKYSLAPSESFLFKHHTLHRWWLNTHCWVFPTSMLQG